MSTQSIAVPTQPLYWSVKREMWEHRAIFLAPLVVAAILLFGFVLSLIFFPRRHTIGQSYDVVAVLLMAVATIAGVFYSVDALYGERRDRSILFWKSLPVSDLTTVLSKAAIPIVVLPLLTFAATVVTQLIILLLSSVVQWGSVNELWSQFFQKSLLLLYHLVTVHGLWHAPIYGWLLLVSGRVRSAPFLWAVFPPAAIAALERIIFRTTYFAAMLGNRIAGESGAMSTRGSLPMDSMAHFAPGHFLSASGLWMGLLFAAACLFAAARQRRNREPI